MLGLVIGFLFMLVVGVAFTTLGGLLGAMLFRKDAAAAGPPRRRRCRHRRTADAATGP